MSILDWAVENNIQGQNEWTKAEFCLLAYRTGRSLPGLTFSSPLYYEVASKFDPSDYPSVYELEELEDNYEKAYVAGFFLTSDFDRINPVLGLHQLYFYTDFGLISHSDQSYIDFIQDQSLIDYWEGNNTYALFDWVSSCRLGLKCLGQELNNQAFSNLNQLSSQFEYSWPAYHAFLVNELAENV